MAKEPKVPAHLIAIVGMACVYPGAHSPQELWQNVLAGRRFFRKSPSERLPLTDYFDPDPNVRAWTQIYIEKFKIEPDSFAMLYYDTANFLFQAIQAVGPHRTKIRDWLEENTYKGLAGQYNFDEEHNGAWFAMIVQYHMKNGKAVPEIKKKYDFTLE